MGDLNYIDCNNDPCKHWHNGRCNYFMTGNCVEIVLDGENAICNSFKESQSEESE